MSPDHLLSQFLIPQKLCSKKCPGQFPNRVITFCLLMFSCRFCFCLFVCLGFLLLSLVGYMEAVVF